MSKEFFEAVKMLEQEKGIPADYLYDKISAAIVVAAKHDYNGKDIVHCDIDPEKEKIKVYVTKNVVEEVEDPDTDLTLEEAQQIRKSAKVGKTIDIPLKTKEFGRIIAQNAKHVIRQGIREAERGKQLAEFQSKNQELVTAKVNRIDPVTGSATVEIGKTIAVLPKMEQIPGEVITEGESLKIFVVDVKDSGKGPKIMISRTHPGLVRRLFETEVPEIYDGTIEIKSVSREAGSRTKIAVYSKFPILLTLSAEKKLISLNTAMMLRNLFPQRLHRLPFAVLKFLMRMQGSAVQRFRMISSVLQSATRVKMFALPPSSQAGK